MDGDHILRNRGAWDEWAAEFVEPGERSWASAPRWGIWGVPDTELGVLPEDGYLEGKDAIELGCGTGYVSSWLARRGARPLGIDNSSKQLETARRLQHEHDVVFPIMQGNAEALPFPDATFDFAISEYGASIWADPYKWIPEASRVLRPGGRLTFLVNGTLTMVCSPDNGDKPDEQLHQDYFGMYRFEWPDWPSVEFHLGYGDWIRLLRVNGFEIEDLIEIQAPVNATTSPAFGDQMTPEWARRWPGEEVWKARKR